MITKLLSIDKGLGFAFLLLFFFHPVETGDVWWHLKTGQWIMQHGWVPQEDPFPFAGEHTPWLCYHWLGSTILYLVFKTGGLVGLKIFRALLFTGAVGIFLSYARRRLPFSLLLVLGLLMAYGLSDRVLLRPDMFNVVFIQLFLIALFAYERTTDRKKLFILPALGILWFNLHIGAFTYGLPLISIFLLSAAAKGAKTQIKDLSLVLAACLAAFLVNPYGLAGFLHPFKTFLVPDYIGFNKISATVFETQPPVHIFLSFGYAHYFILFFLCLVLLYRNKNNNFNLTVLFLFALFTFLYMARNSSFFVIVCAYIIAETAGRIKFHWPKTIDRCLYAGLLCFLLVRGWNIYNAENYYNGRVVRYLSVEDNIPCSTAIQWFKDHGIIGPVFDPDTLGGQLLWSAYPAIRPFTDGRFLDRQRYNDTVAILTDPGKVWPIAEKNYGFKAVILNAGSPAYFKLMRYLNERQEWQLAAIKGPLVIYVPKGTSGLSAALEPSAVSDGDIQQLKELLARKPPSPLQRFLHPSPARLDVFTEALTLTNLGYKGAAVKKLIEALKVSDQPDIRKTASAFLP